MISNVINEQGLAYSKVFTHIDLETAWLISSSQHHTLIKGLEDIKRNSYNIHGYDYQKYLFHFMIYGYSCYNEHHNTSNTTTDDDHQYILFIRILSGVMSIHDYNNNHDKFNDALLSLELFVSNHNTIDDINDDNIKRNSIINDNDTYSIISMYALGLIQLYDNDSDKFMSESSQLHSFISSCLNNIKISITNNMNENDDLNESATLSIHILQTLFSKGQNMKVMMLIINNHIIDYLDTLLSILLMTPISREKITKKILNPLTSLIWPLTSSNPTTTISSDNTGIYIDKIWKFCQLVLPKNVIDLNIVTILLCMLLNSSMNAIDHFKKIDNFWFIICDCFLHSDMVIRKRAAFILQHIVPKVEKKVKSQKPWYVDFLVIYNQIEGCVSEHLLSQIWPIFDSLCLQVTSNNIISSANNDGYPLLNFDWIKVMINCILFQTHPQIRKLVLYRVFTSVASVPCTLATAEWLCYDLLSNHLDNVLYFSANYLGRDKDVGCAQALEDATEQKAGTKFGVLKNISDNKNETNGNTVINACQKPGVLLPYFITRFMKTVTLQSTSDDVNAYLMRSLLNVICGDMKSTSAIKWILRTFSESIVLDLVPIFIGTEELQLIKRFFLTYVAVCNARMKEQILQSLLPLLLKGYNVQQFGLSPLLRLLVKQVGLRKIISDNYTYSLLADVIKRGALKSDENGALVCNLEISEDSDWNLVVLVRSFLDEGDCNDFRAIEEWDKIIDEKIKLCANLYLNPYIPCTQQLAAFWFTFGAASLFSVLYDLNNVSDVGERFKIMMMTFLYKFSPIINDLTSYFSISISTSLASIPTNVKDKLSFSTLASVSVVNNTDLLDAATETLIGLMLMPKIYDSKVNEGQLAALVILITFLNDSISTKVPNVTDASSDLLIALADIKRTLAIRCSAQLLSGYFLRAFPQNVHDFDSMRRLLDLSSDLTFSIFKTESPQSQPYRSTLDYLITRQPIEIKENEKLSLHYNYLDKCNQFSFMSIMFLEYKWSSLKSGMQIIGAVASKTRASNTLSSSQIEDILSLALEQLTVCSEAGLPSLLGCCKAAIGALLPIPSDFDLSVIETVPIQTMRIIENLLSLACNVTLHDGLGYIEMKIMAALIELVFDMHILFYINFDIISDYFKRLFQMGLQNRPHLMQCIVNHLCTVWMSHHYFSIPFFDQIKKLLVYREQKKDDNNSPESNTFNDAHVSCRVMVLTFLEAASIKITSNPSNNEIDKKFISCVQQLIVDFVNMSIQKEYVVQSVIGTQLFGEKLRSWQALCIVSNMITEEIVIDIADKYFIIISHVCAHAIRVHMEIFGSVLLSKYPVFILPKLFRELKEFNQSQQKLSSLFVILMHFIDYAKGNDEIMTVSLAQNIIDHIMPWLSCAAGLPRSIGQLIITTLVPIVIKDQVELSSGHVYLVNILSYLENNKDAQKMIPRQKLFFREFSISNLCSVKGLNKIKLDNGGEIIPDHMLDLIIEVLKENTSYENSKEVIMEDHVDYPIINSNEITFQTKRISFDQLQLKLENELLSRRQNAIGRQKQQVIMCASLVEKATNIAGIVRTCEIFAVEELIISDIRVMQTDDFKGISVNAGDWLQIREVAASRLVSYLVNMKSQGYCIIGLEQTDSSLNMMTATLPNKCVLLLGKEKEGIPVELLQLIDVCIEIPQFGVTRSLNVHVSAALLLWEVTKQNKSFT